ncbi:response regulator transcription factor, partial [Bacillus sp. SIMBA_069]
DIEVVGTATDGRDAVELSRRLHPDVVIMDIRMPELDGIAATTEICADPDLSEVRVLILTTFDEDEYLVAALRAGASGFVGKGAEPDEIARA